MDSANTDNKLIQEDDDFRLAADLQDEYLTIYRYNRDEIKSMPPDEVNSLAQLIGLNENIYDGSRLVRILELAGVYSYTSEYNKLCGLCPNNNTVFNNFCGLCEYFPNINSQGGYFSQIEHQEGDIQMMLINNIVNQMYANEKVHVNGIILHPRMVGGFGDIIFAAKMYYLLKHTFNTDINIICDTKETVAFSSLDGTIPLLSTHEPVPENLNHPDFMILLPHIGLSPENFKKKYPVANILPKLTFAIDEYNFLTNQTSEACKYFKSAGLLSDFMGIFIDHHPERYTGITESIFANFYNNYIGGSRIFMGYAYEWENASNFIYLILLFYDYGLYQDVDENVTIFSRFDSNKINGKIEFVRYAQELGYHVSFVSNYREYSYQGDGGKTLTIVNTTGIKYADLQYIMRISDKFCCITGDQSLSDAISHDKYYIYEELHHKVNLRESLLTLMQLSDCTQIIGLWNELYESGNASVILRGTNSEYIRYIYRSIYNSGEYEKFNLFIKSYFDIAPNITGQIKRFKRYLEHPEIIREEKKYFDELSMTYIGDDFASDEYFTTIEDVIAGC